MSQQAIREALEAYRASLPSDSPRRTAPWVAEGFGDGPELADRLGALVLAGVKTATCSAWWKWQASGDPLPRAGLLTVVLDGRGRPLAITETTEVRILAFNQVDEQWAREEGEGDRTLAWWRQAHWSYFQRTLPRIGRSPAEDMPLVCERFRRVYPP
ncbi:MAG: ASCH domain-containing protein [Spirochaetes bacterium RBG_16_67_19]|nr:MAG: ASCH domain-containing protein [Spirochaetes bacterium RBG_16_67_19]